MFAVEIKGAHYSHQNGDLRASKNLKMELLEHYGVKIILVSTTGPREFQMFKNKQELELIRYIEELIEEARQRPVSKTPETDLSKTPETDNHNNKGTEGDTHNKHHNQGS